MRKRFGHPRLARDGPVGQRLPGRAGDRGHGACPCTMTPMRIKPVSTQSLGYAPADKRIELLRR
ncbi:MAG: hypothetical protein R3E52_17340, partial [Burkholderiaceae bacterium]